MKRIQRPQLPVRFPALLSLLSRSLIFMGWTMPLLLPQQPRLLVELEDHRRSGCFVLLKRLRQPCTERGCAYMV
jgi:hypothetical protein